MADVVPFPVEYWHRHVVLIVDDESAVRSVLCEFLRDCNFHPLAAASAEEAIRLFHLGIAIDLVFSDVRMPGELDGYGLAQWMIENRPDIPIILATGEMGKCNAAAQLCAVETLAKPYAFMAAAKKIRDTIHRHKRRKA